MNETSLWRDSHNVKRGSDITGGSVMLRAAMSKLCKGTQ